MDLENSIKELKKIQNYSDTEAAHVDADDVLCEFLRSQGFDDLVDEFEKINKWYA